MHMVYIRSSNCDTNHASFGLICPTSANLLLHHTIEYHFHLFIWQNSSPNVKYVFIWILIYICVHTNSDNYYIFHTWSNSHELLLQEVAEECQNMNWGTFKPLLTDALIEHLHPIQVLTLYMVLCLKIKKKEFKVQGTFVYLQWWFLNLCNCNDDFLYFHINIILVIVPSLFGISSKHLKVVGH